MGYSFALAGEPKGCRGRAESPPASGITRQLCRMQFPVKRPDSPSWGAGSGTCRSMGRSHFFFRWRKKSVQKKASGTATPEAARPAARYSQISAFRALPCPALVFAQACQSLTAYGSCAHWARAPSRPKLRSAGAERLDDPNKFWVVQFRPKGRNSLTTFRGQTALRGCPRARGVRCRIAPCRSLCSPPTLPAGRFGLRPRPHWGHASLRDSSLRSPARREEALLLPILPAGLATSRAT